MNMSGNTILVTGGGSGIGRGLAEGLQRLGNTVVIAGRRREALEAVVAANPGMALATLDIEDPASVTGFARTLVHDHPALNVLVNNAGVMRPEDFTAEEVDLSTAEAEVATNLLGPIRLTAALLPHLRSRPTSAIMNVSSGLAFVPMTATPTYSATKAALHSFSQSLREQLKATSTEVIEIIPPYVQTTLMGDHQAADPRAMPLDDYLRETLELLQTRPTPAEVLVERVAFLRRAEAEGRYDATFAAVNSH